jgi:hypothetical protein
MAHDSLSFTWQEGWKVSIRQRFLLNLVTTDMNNFHKYLGTINCLISVNASSRFSVIIVQGILSCFMFSHFLRTLISHLAGELMHASIFVLLVIQISFEVYVDHIKAAISVYID